MITALIVGVMLFISAVFYQMILFDRLVKWEYEHHREQWERDGRPVGYFWKADECGFWSGDNAKKRVEFLWIFRTPRWISESPVCQRWLVKRRAIFIMCCMAVASLLYCLLFRIFLR
jgi:hypothetical protein